VDDDRDGASERGGGGEVGRDVERPPAGAEQRYRGQIPFLHPVAQRVADERGPLRRRIDEPALGYRDQQGRAVLPEIVEVVRDGPTDVGGRVVP